MICHVILLFKEVSRLSIIPLLDILDLYLVHDQSPLHSSLELKTCGELFRRRTEVDWL